MTYPWLGAHQEQLARALEQGLLGHALLISGPPGTGKRALADWLVARVLCHKPEGIEVCGRCRSCSLLASGAHPDRFLAVPDDDRSVITVDTVRELGAMLLLTPALGKHRVGHIVPADAMNINAANALLKTMEEPADNVWLILVADRPDSLPATIRSRGQAIYVRPPGTAVARAWLTAALPEATEDDCEAALELAASAPLTALGWLRDGGLDSGRGILAELEALAVGKSDPQAAAARMNRTPDEVWSWLAVWCARLARWRATGRAEIPLPENLLASLKSVSPQRLMDIWQDAIAGRRLAATPVRHDLLISRWLIQWRRVAADSA